MQLIDLPSPFFPSLSTRSEEPSLVDVEYTVLSLAQRLRPEAVRKLRGALAPVMREVLLAYDIPFSRREFWDNNHRIRQDGARQLHQGPNPIAYRSGPRGEVQLIFNREARAALADLMLVVGSLPTLQLGSTAAYTVEVTKMHFERYTTGDELAPHHYQVQEFVAFTGKSWRAWKALCEQLGLGNPRTLDRIEHPALLNALQYSLRRHVPTLYQAYTGATWPAGAPIVLDTDRDIGHHLAEGSGQRQVSAFSGIRFTSPVRLPYHWGVGHERARNLGRVEWV